VYVAAVQKLLAIVHMSDGMKELFQIHLDEMDPTRIQSARLSMQLWSAAAFRRYELLPADSEQRLMMRRLLRDVCFRKYVQQGKTMDEVVELVLVRLGSTEDFVMQHLLVWLRTLPQPAFWGQVLGWLLGSVWLQPSTTYKEVREEEMLWDNVLQASQSQLQKLQKWLVKTLSAKLRCNGLPVEELDSVFLGGSVTGSALLTLTDSLVTMAWMHGWMTQNSMHLKHWDASIVLQVDETVIRSHLHESFSGATLLCMCCCACVCT
jgi:hypothetical protein